jgi:hypothetical protein
VVQSAVAGERAAAISRHRVACALLAGPVSPARSVRRCCCPACVMFFKLLSKGRLISQQRIVRANRRAATMACASATPGRSPSAGATPTGPVLPANPTTAPVPFPAHISAHQTARLMVSPWAQCRCVATTARAPTTAFAPRPTLAYPTANWPARGGRLDPISTAPSVRLDATHFLAARVWLVMTWSPFTQRTPSVRAEEGTSVRAEGRATARRASACALRAGAVLIARIPIAQGTFHATYV